jgi:hypothetical protein
MQGTPKLFDFGISAVIRDCINTENEMTFTSNGRIAERWTAPEQLVSSLSICTPASTHLQPNDMVAPERERGPSVPAD